MRTAHGRPPEPIGADARRRASRDARALVVITLVAGTYACTSAPSASGDAGHDAAPATDAAARDAGLDDASSNDAGTADAGSDAGLGDCTGRLLCDDFEGYAVGGPPGGPWAVSTNAATLVVDDARAASGTHAIHIVTGDASGTYRRAFLSVEGAPFFPLPHDEMWGRLRIYAVTLPGLGAAVHWTNVQAEGPIPSMSGVTALYRYGGMNDDRWIANYETSGASSDCWRNSATAMQAGRWVCMEWHFASETNTMELFVDGARIDDAAIAGRGDGCVSPSWTSDWLGGSWTTLRVGWEHYQTTDSHEVFVDDVAMDTARIGCP
jgi:hypothetical protein